MPTLDSKYMVAEERQPLGYSTTRRWEILSKSSGELLGGVGWYGPWRQFCFFPREETVFNGGCLQSIVKFLKEAMAEHKRKTRRA